MKRHYLVLACAALIAPLSEASSVSFETGIYGFTIDTSNQLFATVAFDDVDLFVSSASDDFGLQLPVPGAGQVAVDLTFDSSVITMAFEQTGLQVNALDGTGSFRNTSTFTGTATGSYTASGGLGDTTGVFEVAFTRAFATATMDVSRFPDEARLLSSFSVIGTFNLSGDYFGTEFFAVSRFFGIDGATGNIQIGFVPLPGSVWFLLSGLAALGVTRRPRRVGR